MSLYEITVESMNPCGGEAHAIREILEVETESPEAYVRANGRYPVIETRTDAYGDTVIVTGNDRGYKVRYTFSE